MYSNLIFTKTLIALFLIILAVQTSNAQYDKLQQDPNITWIAEFTIDHNFSLSVPDTKENVMLTKLYKDPAVNDYSNTDNWIIDWVYQSAIDGKVNCFQDPGLTQTLSQKAIVDMVSYVDTVVIFDSETYEERVAIVEGSLNPKEIKMLRCNQVIYYNNKSKNFETKLISVAPVINKDSRDEPIFWIKMNEEISNNFDIHHSDITWGALVYSKSNPLELNFTNVIKNVDDFNFQKTIYEQAVNLEKKAESAQGYGSNVFMSSKEIESMYMSVDTVITFNPDTYEEVFRIITNEFSYDKVAKFRLMQEWYYDSKKNKLLNRLKAIAPIIRFNKESGEFLFLKPLYYIRYD